ncbi:MAG: fused MFS/spermidine synthase [Anaerolineae bacterium]|nr:fused MFS/spermidine synthase [Anaerolineae bacterium]
MFLYAATILVSALLLFLVQPLISRYILPWFGGTSAVWSTSMLFFQLLLLAGYLYSHLVVRRLSRRRQVWVHGALLVLSLALMALNLTVWGTPITPGDNWAPATNASPLLRILVTLLVSVGLPYFVLSTTSPLLQTWFAERFPERSPYPLYALSNVGSIVALLGYPFVLQRVLPVTGQAGVWSLGYVVFAVALAAIAWTTLGSRTGVRRSQGGRYQNHSVDALPAVAAGPGRLAWWRPVLWVAFPAISSVILLGATNQMTQNVAAVPLLWIVPLVLYLLTFVIAFSGAGGTSRWYLVLLLVAMPPFRNVLLVGNNLPILLQLGIHSLVVFAASMVCHSELVRLRPRVSDLTVFYLAVSFGGALGGVLVNLVAPAVFVSYWELPIGVMACWGFTGIALYLERPSLPQKKLYRNFWMIILGVAATVYAGGIVRSSVIAFYQATLAASRNFYGALRVQTMMLGDSPGAEAYRLVHGTTIHGVQYVDPAQRDVPTSYFGPTSGVGMAATSLRDAAGPRRIGVLGLGIGTLAAYGEPGDVMRFYEIDPQVIAYAEGEAGYFSYLAECAADVEIVVGDARLSLERELDQDGGMAYDLLAVDVFSGDSPPVHLLTREAFDVYLAHLAPDGILAMNISTMYLNLKPVVAGLADDAGLTGIIVEDMGDGVSSFPSRWVLMARDADVLSEVSQTSYPDLQEAADPDLRLWTDDYSNLIEVMH